MSLSCDKTTHDRIKGKNWFCVQQDVKNAVLEDMRAVGKEAGLNSFEQVSKLLSQVKHASYEVADGNSGPPPPPFCLR